MRDIQYPPLLTYISNIVLSCQETNEGDSTDPLYHMNQLMESLKNFSNDISRIPDIDMTLEEIKERTKAQQEFLNGFSSMVHDKMK
jgi:hypothetical protein